MKRINEYKKLFNVTPGTSLGDLKKTYRGLVKEWHPDKFQDNDEKAKEADVMSLKVIDGYHFLVSINPETIAKNLDEYNETITSPITDWHHKGQVLEISFLNGDTYEYFGVNKALFTKFISTDKMTRFAKRSIFKSFTYRKIKKSVVKEA